MASEEKPAKALKKGGGQGKMDPVQRARHSAYQQPSKSVAASLALTHNRLREHALKSRPTAPKQTAELEGERRARVVGQLKAAEARNQIRSMRLCFQRMRAQELHNLIVCQPSARDAIRLEVFLSPQPRGHRAKDPLHHSERERVESLLKDDTGLRTNRIP